MDKKIYIETLGCQMNKSDTEKILGILEAVGYERTHEAIEANLLIINTCSIRAASEDKAFSHLGVWGKWKRSNPELKIAICGCIAQQSKQKIFKRAPYIDLIFGTHNIDELPELINKLKSSKRVCSASNTPYKSDQTFKIKRENTITAWLPIIEGCDYFCTYCVVPYTRGRQRSRLPEDIIKEAQEIADQGYKEITLLGQTVDSYGRDLDNKDISLANLLKELNKIENLYRIRFLTSHPADMTDELIDTVKELDKVCEYFHIPMQSGNTEILDKMKRKYTREQYIELVTKIRSKIPYVGITTDFIAGFPGETEEQFNDTLTIIDELSFDQCITASYSPRLQTPAATWKKEHLSKEVKKDRINRMHETGKQATKRSNDKEIGRIVEILVEKCAENDETMLNGRARNNKIVHFKGDKSLISTLVNVEITSSANWCLKGELVQ